MRIATGLASLLLGMMVLAAWGSEIPGMGLPNPSIDFAINPESGVVAAVEAEKDLVRFYPDATNGSARESTVVAVGEGPVAVIFKKFQNKSYFLVLCHTDQTVVVIDGGTLKQVEEVKLPVTDAGLMVAAAGAEDPYVYVIGKGTGAQYPGSMVIDMRTMKEVGMVGVGGNLNVQRNSAAISGDGQIAYGLRSNVISPRLSAARVTRQEAGKPPILEESNAPITSNERDYVADPLGETVAVGREIYTADLQTRLGTVELPVACYLQHKPFLVLAPGQVRNAPVVRGEAVRMGMGERILLVSRNTFKTVGSLEMPERPAPLSPMANNFAIGSEQFPFRQKVLVDGKNGHLLVCDKTAIRVVALKEFEAPEEPFLGATVEGSTQWAVGVPASVRLIQRDATQKVEIRKGPEGMILQGDRITWTPSAKDVGEGRVDLKYSDGSMAIARQVRFSVSQPAATLPFAATRMVVAKDGATALVEQARPADRTTPASTRLVMMDLETSNVLADRTVEKAISQMAMDDHYVYIGISAQPVLMVLSRKDLTEVKTVAMPTSVAQINAGGRRIGVFLTSGAVGYVDVGDLAFVEFPLGRNLRLTSSTGYTGKIGDDLCTSGVIFDANFEKIRAVTQVNGLRSIGNSASQVFSQTPAVVSRWGISADGRAGPYSSGIGYVPSPGGARVISEEAPFSVVLSTTRGNGPSDRERAELAFCDLKQGQARERFPVWDTARAAQTGGIIRSDSATASSRMQIAAGKVFLLNEEHLYMVHVPAIDPNTYPEPLQIVSDQGLVVMSADKPTVLQFRTTGGAGNAEFALMRPMAGVEITKEGKLTIEPETWVAQGIDNLTALRPRVDPTTGLEAPQNLISYEKTAVPVFRALVGREPEGIPIVVGITVTARDKEWMPVRTDRALLLEIPEKKLQERIAEMRDPHEKITTLEKRIEELEKKIDALNQAVKEERNK